MNLQEMCRICLACTTNSKLINMFITPTIVPIDSIVNAIMECAPVNISLNDGLPEQICSICIQNLFVAHTFHKLCIQSDHKLREIVESTSLQTKDDVVQNCSADYVDEEISNNDSKSNTKVLSSCSLCNKGFRTSRSLKQHQSRTHKAELYKCIECCETFTTKLAHRKHSRTAHKITQKVLPVKKFHKCSFCEKVFNRNFQALVHERVHTGERPYVCDVCGKAFASHSNFTSHQIIHTGERPFKCTVCDATRISAEELKRHMRVHSDNYLYKCDICGQGFKWSSNKVKHMRRHRGERNYKCDYCNKAFYDTYQLKAHMVIHTGERPFSCNICNFTYKREDHLRKHNKRIHKPQINSTVSQTNV